MGLSFFVLVGFLLATSSCVKNASVIGDQLLDTPTISIAKNQFEIENSDIVLGANIADFVEDASYTFTWRQISGETQTLTSELSSATSSSISFSVGDVQEQILIEFEVVAKIHTGTNFAKETISVFVSNSNATLLGPIGSAVVIVYNVAGPSFSPTIITSDSTESETSTIVINQIANLKTTSFDGALFDAGTFNFRGSVFQSYSDEDWFLVNVSTGKLLDVNIDGIVDFPILNNFAPNGLFGLARYADWRNGAVINALTELAFYGMVGTDWRNVSLLSSNNIEFQLTSFAIQLFKNSIYDSSKDGGINIINYRDILHFSPYNPEHLAALKLDYISQIQPLIEELYLNQNYLDITHTLYIDSIISNNVPQITLPDSITVIVDQDYTLTAQIVDEDSLQNLKIRWSEIANSQINVASTSATLSLKLSEQSLGETITLHLSVQDSISSETEETVAVLLKRPNLKPNIQNIFIDAGDDGLVQENELVKLSIDVEDIDGSISQIKWIQTGGVGLVLAGNNVTEVLFTAAPVDSSHSEVTLLVQVFDNEFEMSETEYKFKIYDVNNPPELIIAKHFEFIDNTFSTITADFEVEEDGSVIQNVSWYIESPFIDFENANLLDASLYVNDVGLAGETLVGTIVLTDDSNDSVAETFTVYIRNKNRAPSLTHSFNVNGEELTEIILTAVATDPDINSEYNYQWSSLVVFNTPEVDLQEISETQVSFQAPDIDPDNNIVYVVVDFNDGHGAAISSTIQITLKDLPPVAMITVEPVEVTHTFVLQSVLNLTVEIINSEETGFSSTIIADGMYGTAEANGVQIIYTVDDEDAFVYGDEFQIQVQIADGSAISSIVKAKINYYDNQPPSFTSFPQSGSIDIPTRTTITLKSDIPLNSNTIFNTKNVSCIGSIALSSDGFTNCIGFLVQYSNFSRDLVLELDETLLPDQNYVLRITDQVQSIFSVPAPATEIEFTTARGKILVNEISSSFQDSSLRWIEIYNSSDELAFLKNFSLYSRSINANDKKFSEYSFDLPNYTLQPKQHFILRVQNSDSAESQQYPSISGRIAILEDSGSLPYWDKSGYIELRSKTDPAYTEDYVIFGTFLRGSQPATADSWIGSGFAAFGDTAGYSISRKIDSDTNSSLDWVSTPFPTFGAINDALCTNDEDGDSIPDCAEVEGSTYAGIDVYTLGARVNTRDIFIEVDYVDSTQGNDFPVNEGVLPRIESLQYITNLFASQNISLHFDVGDLFDKSPGLNPENFDLGGGEAVPYYSLVGYDLSYLSLAFGYSFYNIKGRYMDINRMGFFHYLLMINQVAGDSTALGASEVEGDDMIVALGYKSLNSTTLNNEAVLVSAQSAAILHQIGHNLGLRHGGDETLDYKVNYFSTMNSLYYEDGLPSNTAPGDRFYQNSFTSADTCYPDTLSNSKQILADFKVDFSRGTSEDINENSIDELIGVGRLIENYAKIDFNCDGDVLDTGFSLNLNIGGDTATTVLKDYNDWENLDLNFRHKSHSNIFGPSNVIE